MKINGYRLGIFSVGLYYTPEFPDATNVAVKILKEGVSNEVKEDFEREVEIMSNFSHDNILSLLGVITKGKGVFHNLISLNLYH